MPLRSPLSATFHPQRNLPLAPHRMNTSREQLEAIWTPTSIIAYALGGTHSTISESSLLEAVQHAVTTILTDSPNVTVAPLAPNQHPIRRRNFPAHLAAISGLDAEQRETLIEVGIVEADQDRVWSVAFHDPNDGGKVITATILDTSLDGSDESCEMVFDAVATTIQDSEEYHRHIEANRDLYPRDATIHRIVKHVCSSLNVIPIPSYPTPTNPDTSHVFIVHIPPTTADIEATRDMVQTLEELGIRVPHGWDSLDEAWLPVLCMKCFAIDHLQDSCRY